MAISLGDNRFFEARVALEACASHAAQALKPISIVKKFSR